MARPPRDPAAPVRRLPRWIWTSPAFPWAVLFLILSLTVTQYGGTNAASRIAATRAITEGHTLSIDNYRDWTLDWALAPNGHYYSDKAPGATLLGLPVFALMDAVVLPLHADRRDARGRVLAFPWVEHVVLMLWLQLLPFSLLVLWIAHRLRERGASAGATHFFALAALFGNTAAIYMNSHFGHGVAALLFLGAFACWSERRYLLTGLLLSFSLLSNYGVAFALPFILAATAWRERSLVGLLQIGAGALPGAGIWIWYHWTAFGSPFVTAIQFTNPAQLEALPGREGSGPGYSLLPSAELVWRLLFGPERGLAVTQPWVFGVAALPFLRTAHAPRGVALFTLGSLGALLWMNAGFGGWHGGRCLGPRYLSVVFPALALALASQWDALHPRFRQALWILLGVALAFRLLVFPFTTLAPVANLWRFYLGLIGGQSLNLTALRYALAIGFSLLAVAWQVQRSRRRPGNGVAEPAGPPAAA